MKKIAVLSIFLSWTFLAISQQDIIRKKERLDFAKMYFEVGGTFLPSFSGRYLLNEELNDFENSASVIQYLNWGGFHFWGHGEFYVTFPIGYQPFQKNIEGESEIFHSVATGFRFYPWVYRDKKLIPYLGANWSALEFKQKVNPEIEPPTLSKDFILGFDAGILYGYKSFHFRLGGVFFPNTKWEYPISKTQKAEISTPNLGLQLGLLYSFDSTKDTKEENIIEWNNFPSVSKPSLGTNRFGDFFIGAGPSISFSLQKSTYSQQEFPYLQGQLASSNYFDLAIGYHFTKADLFTTLSYRNPTFETEGYDTKQSIKKTSITLEVNKFLTDYNGFVPYLGLNIAYDNLIYTETVDNSSREIKIDKRFEPGITLGWDIQPGKNQEALTLRTNLRWFPFSSFEIDDKKFNFSQLEYNLIQVVFYPQRLKRKK